MLSPHAADRARLAELELQILDLERSLSVLRLERTAVQERVDSSTYPVLTLPNEITSEIFIHFLPIYPLCPPLTGILSPTLLTHICRQWREIALATPELWRAIDGEYENGVLPGSEVFTAVLPYRARWEYVKLRLVVAVFSPIEWEAPLLRHLDLHLRCLIYEGAFVIRGAPFLRTAVLDVDDAKDVVLPWAQLTSLTLRHTLLFDSERFLKQTPNLVHCQLDLYDGGIEGVPFITEITLPHLESFCWDGSHIIRSLSDTLGAFRVPALRSLQFSELLLYPDPIEFLTSFISKSNCDLEEVRITGDRFVHEDSYQEAFPSIRFVFDGDYVLGEEDNSVDDDGD